MRMCGREMPDRPPAVRCGMAITQFSALPDDSKIWLFGISPQVDDASAETVRSQLTDFIRNWKSHGEEIVAAGEVIEGSFLAVGITPESEASGCSIDRMFGLLKKLETDLGVEIIDSERVFYRDADGNVRAASRVEFAKVAGPATRVFDVTAERIAAVRSGAWEKPAAESWHARLLG
jgi:hypothetical protein